MSPEGDAFALPSDPKLISGPNILATKKITHTGGRDAYWTKGILFVSADQQSAFQMLRRENFAEMGVLKLDANRAVQGIFECGKSYYALYWDDHLQRGIFEKINDPRLQSGSVVRLRFDDVGAIDQRNSICTIALLKNTASMVKFNAVEILGDGFQERVDLHGFDRLEPKLSASADHLMLLGNRRVGTASQPATAAVMFRIEK